TWTSSDPPPSVLTGRASSRRQETRFLTTTTLPRASGMLPRGIAIKVLRSHVTVVNSVAFGPDGTRVVTASDDRTGRIWEAATGNEIKVLRGHDDLVYSATCR